MEYDSIIAEAEEMIDAYRFIVELITTSEPLNEVIKSSNEFVLKELEGMKKEVEETLKDSKRHQKKHKNEEEEKFKLYYNVVCPHCGTKAQLKPEGEVKQEDYLLYFRFHCRKCKKDFMPEKPNNDSDLMIWYKNLLADINDPDKIIIRNGMPKKFKDSEIKNFKKLQADLITKVSRNNHNLIELQDAIVVLMKMIQDANIWAERVMKDLHDNINIYGLVPKIIFHDFSSTIEAEKELTGLMESVIEMSRNPPDTTVINLPEKKTMPDEIKLIKELLKERIGNRETFLLQEKKILLKRWNEEINYDCPKCKYQGISKPCGEGSSDQGFLYFMFVCKECKERFADKIPNNLVDNKNYHEFILKTKFGNEEDSQKNYLELHTTPERVQGGREQLEELKIDVAKYEKFKTDVQESIDIHDKWLREQIEFLKSIRN